MIYPANFEEKIGFDRIREQVTALCSTPSAKAKLAEEGFSTSADEIERRLSLMNEMRSLLMLERDFPDGDYPDPAPLVAKIRVEGSYLLAAEADQLRKALVTVGAIAEFILGRGGARYPRLWELSRRVTLFPEIVRAIDAILDDRGEVKDSASPELQQVRRAIREREGQAAKRLQQVLQRAKQAGIVDADAVLSVRDGRPVIPVAAANKRKLQGFIHDESATGRTFYVEPVEVVEINNELKELEYAERREVVKVLSAFTESIRPDAEVIADAGDYLSSVDMIRAKGALGACQRRRQADPFDGRPAGTAHGAPSAVAADAAGAGPRGRAARSCAGPPQAYPRDFGPQRGRQVGLPENDGTHAVPVPVRLSRSGIGGLRLPVFRSIFIDIGDEQSIDDDLSTYSSHLRNMKNMLAGASDRTLVLIDEFGSGTEPTIGGAIAEAILERLLERGCYGVVTTHYANIKYFASNAEGVANGAMLFDVQRIRPLFKLEIGKPGSSFAVEIARKIGLPEEIIRAASDKAGSDHINLERQLREIARDKRYWEQKRDRIRLTDRKIEELEQSYAAQLARIRQERSEILRAAKAEARELMAEANRRIEQTIKEIREAQAEREMTRFIRRDLDAFKERVEQADAVDTEKAARIEREMEKLRRRRERREERRRQPVAAGDAQPVVAPPREIEVGSKVVLEGQQTPGVVQSLKRRQGAGGLRPVVDDGRSQTFARGVEQ